GTDADVSEVLHVAGEKGGTGASAEHVVTGDVPLPRSLTRCARSFGGGERYRLTGEVEISWWMPGRNLTGKR
ncbi:hypothetical protein, partial [Escherichia coli]|uniref:hypothetical protein n=1 Tax=Escherichia coli TaxID=562 RepID=UPI001BAF6DBC